MFHATFIEENNEFKAQLVHEQVDEITAEGTRQKGIVVAAGTEQVLSVNNVGAVQVHSVENAGAEQVDAVTAEGNTQKSAITTYCEGQQVAIDQKVSAANNAKDDAVTAKEQAETAQRNSETAANTATQKASEAAQHDILTQTELTDEQQITARTNINAAPVDGSYELIETITLTENAASIVRTQEPDGTAYNLKGVVIEYAVAAGSAAGNLQARLYNSSATKNIIHHFGGAISAAARFFQSNAEILRGRWTGYRTSAGVASYETPQLYGLPLDAIHMESDFPACAKITISSATTGVSIPAGSVFKIYGVRA